MPYKLISLFHAYKVLGLEKLKGKQFTEGEITDAYLKVVASIDLDTHGDDPVAKERSQDLSRAYQQVMETGGFVETEDGDKMQKKVPAKVAKKVSKYSVRELLIEKTDSRPDLTKRKKTNDKRTVVSLGILEPIEQNYVDVEDFPPHCSWDPRRKQK